MASRNKTERSARDEKKRSWPDFALWSQRLWQGNEETAASKPLDPALYIVATPIGNRGDITLRALWTLAHVDAILCEDTRVTAQLLRGYGLHKTLISCHDHNEAAREAEVTKRLADGQALALVSDAGTPLISDPGFRLVRACRVAGLSVFALPGACAAITALSSAGLPTDRFFFAGFLPPKGAARKELLRLATSRPETVIFYESGPRLAATLRDLMALCGPERPVAIARELTKLFEEVRTAALGELTQEAEANGPAKGELVLLLGPTETTGGAASPEMIEKHLRQALKTMSVRDAAATVATVLNLKKSDVYQAALRLSTQ